jgi:single-strand DNA-binding protein
MAINSVVLVGRLTRDPELKYTPTGNKAVCNFSLAVDREFAASDGTRQADFINIVSWNGTAEFIPKYFEKGDLMGVKGVLTSRKYTDKDGNNRVSYEVIATQVSFVGGKRERNLDNTQGDAYEPEQKQQNGDAYFTIDDDADYPF